MTSISISANGCLRFDFPGVREAREWGWSGHKRRTHGTCHAAERKRRSSEYTGERTKNYEVSVDKIRLVQFFCPVDPSDLIV